MNALIFTLATLVPLAGIFILLKSYNNSKVKTWLFSPSREGRFYSVNDRQLFASIKGEGTPVMIVPGLGTPSAEWWPLQDKLSQYAQVITFDRPGYGKSEATTKPRKCKEIINEMKLLLNKMDINEPVILIGQAEGALYAQFFARIFPKMVAGVIMIDPVLENFKWKDKVSDKVFNKLFDGSISISKAKRNAAMGFKRITKRIKLKNPAKTYTLNHFCNKNMYDVWNEEYNYVMDQGCLAVKIAPPFPEVALNVIYHNSSSKIEAIRKKGINQETATEIEKIWSEMAGEYLELSPYSNWTELPDAHTATQEEILIESVKTMMADQVRLEQSQFLVAAGA